MDWKMFNVCKAEIEVCESDSIQSTSRRMILA